MSVRSQATNSGAVYPSLLQGAEQSFGGILIAIDETDFRSLKDEMHDGGGSDPEAPPVIRTALSLRLG